LGIKVSPNPFNADFTITASKTLTNVQLILFNAEGQQLSRQTIGMITAGSSIQPALPVLQKGVYFLQVETKQYKTTIKLLHL